MPPTYRAHHVDKSVEEIIKTVVKADVAIVSVKEVNDGINKVKQAAGQSTRFEKVIISSLPESLNKSSLQDELESLSGRSFAKCGNVLVFVRGSCVGSVNDLLALHKTGVLTSWLKAHDYDLVVIGGGSGGIAAAKEAAELGMKVCVFDYVEPSPLGTQWGLGGTCVNVGCIPKKLMHQGALLRNAQEDSKFYGWKLDKAAEHSWGDLVQSVQNHVKSLNFKHRVELREKSITYKNAKAYFKDPFTVAAVDKKGKEETVTADKFLISVGLRPRYLEGPGFRELCITSDDLFSHPTSPGKTLCVGASYVSLECAGFLKEYGLEVAVAVRSILLRGFDQDMAGRIGNHMEEHGIRFLKETVPRSVQRISDGPDKGRLMVEFSGKGDQKFTEVFDTVLLAIGRDAVTDPLHLSRAGVKTNPKNKKVIVNEVEQSSMPNIYAIGDVADAKLELTPVAILAGKMLARRLTATSTLQMDYRNVPTTVFTPLEYGACGFSEDDARAEIPNPDENIEVYHTHFIPLEFKLPNRDEKHCYCKLVCRRDKNDRVIGVHYLGPNAGEVTQGFAIAVKFGATKGDFDTLVGIHPTTAETFTKLRVTKRSGKDAGASSC